MMLCQELLGTCLRQANRRHALTRAGRECVIDLATDGLPDTLTRIGNVNSTEHDKFERFGLTASPPRHACRARCTIVAMAASWCQASRFPARGCSGRTCWPSDPWPVNAWLGTLAPWPSISPTSTTPST